MPQARCCGGGILKAYIFQRYPVSEGKVGRGLNGRGGCRSAEIHQQIKHGIGHGPQGTDADLEADHAIAVREHAPRRQQQQGKRLRDAAYGGILHIDKIDDADDDDREPCSLQNPGGQGGGNAHEGAGLAPAEGRISQRGQKCRLAAVDKHFANALAGAHERARFLLGALRRFVGAGVHAPAQYRIQRHAQQPGGDDDQRRQHRLLPKQAEKKDEQGQDAGIQREQLGEHGAHIAAPKHALKHGRAFRREVPGIIAMEKTLHDLRTEEERDILAKQGDAARCEKIDKILDAADQHQNGPGQQEEMARVFAPRPQWGHRPEDAAEQRRGAQRVAVGNGQRHVGEHKDEKQFRKTLHEHEPEHHHGPQTQRPLEHAENPLKVTGKIPEIGQHFLNLAHAG